MVGRADGTFYGGSEGFTGAHTPLYRPFAVAAHARVSFTERSGLLLREGARAGCLSRSPNFASQDIQERIMSRHRTITLRVPGENLRIRKEQTVEAPSFQDALERFTHWPAAEAWVSRAWPVPNILVPTFATWRRGKFSCWGELILGKEGFTAVYCAPFSQYPVSPDANVGVHPPPLTKRKRRTQGCIRREGSVMWIVEKPKRARCVVHPGLFFLVRGGRFWAMAFRTAVAPPSISQKSLGEDLFRKVLPGIHTL